MTDISFSDLSFGTICRIAVTLSTCFWIPVSILLGIVGATGATPIEGLHHHVNGFASFVAGAAQGIGMSVAMDVMLVAGALSALVAHRLWGGATFRLKLRKAPGSVQ
ncbi:MAG: hypothetical protein CMN72_06940 [Sphingomonas sp.]|nr:hypothetical protein [Sphingomonas sp.]